MVKEAINKLNKLKKLIEKYDWLLAIVVSLAVIAIGFFIGWYNNKIIPSYGNPHFLTISSNPLKILSNWDGPDYLYIAQHGYVLAKNTGFFPLYPILIRAFHYVFRSYLWSGLIVSWTFMVGAIYYYLQIAKEIKIVNTKLDSFKALVVFIFMPTGVFLFAAYGMSLVCMLGFASVYFSLKKKWYFSAILLALAAAAHPLGVLFIILDALILLSKKVSLSKIVGTIIGGCLGLIGYMIYLYFAFNNALSFVKEQQNVHGWMAGHYLTLITSTNFFNALFFVLVVLSVIYFIKKNPSFSLFSVLFLLIPIIGGQWGGFNRYVLIDFTIPLMIYDYLKNKAYLYTSTVILLVVFWTYTLLQYTGGYIGS